MANKKFNSWIKNICMGWGFIMAGSLLASCNDLMHDDLPPCDMGVDLQFKYDYNVQRADMFKDHVGGLCVFVYDEQGNFIARHDAYNDATSQPLKDPNYAMRINLEPGKYRFATFAFQKKYEDALAQPGAKFQIALPQQGDNYTLKLTLEKNNQSENPRTGTITVTYGDLSLDITIKQAGFDFRKDDPDRTVIMQYNNSTVADDYFNWLDGVQGITPEEMQGAVRNDGLHFCVGTANITYLIPKLNGDQITKKDDKIKVEEDKGKWKVSLANTTVNEDLWKSSFTITNQAGIEITYPVYHTGIFHKIDENSKVYNDYQLAENGDKTKKVKGWFYYGVVKVEGKKADETTTTYYMLDRNLGASNNGYYAPDVVALAKNKKAIGGYFCISEKKSTSDATQDLSSTLAPTGYTIPTDAVFEELVNAGNLEVVPQSTSLGETYNCVRIKTVDSELPYIYLPMGGFLEGESHKNPIHVNLWTKTLLSGTQGFGTNSPEYGFWYRYFDVYNKRKGLSNMRFVSGSNGMNNGRYKAMPIRLILK